jgi:hypothetical protein
MVPKLAPSETDSDSTWFQSGSLESNWKCPWVTHQPQYPHNIKVIREVSLSFTPYPLFQWYLQSKEILLNLKMKCW